MECKKTDIARSQKEFNPVMKGDFVSRCLLVLILSEKLW